MIAEAKAFWDAISGKVKSLIRSETENALRLQRYDVTTPPDGSVIGVTQPYGANEIFLPYSQEVAGATTGDTVLVAWWGSMSNAKAYYFANGYEGAGAVSPYDGTPANLGTASAGTSASYARGDHVHAMPTAEDVGAMATWGELLWTNASPTAAFAAQTLSLDLTEYSAVAIEINLNNTGNFQAVGIAFVGAANTIFGKAASSATLFGRYATVAADGITFNNGYSGSTAGESYAIPRRIYGIR